MAFLMLKQPWLHAVSFSATVISRLSIGKYNAMTRDDKHHVIGAHRLSNSTTGSRAAAAEFGQLPIAHGLSYPNLIGQGVPNALCEWTWNKHDKDMCMLQH